MGLLGQGWNDPNSAAIMALAGNMVRGGLNGGFGGGLLAAQDAYQNTQTGLLNRQLTQAQLGEIAMKNQMEQYQLKRLQDWDKLVNGDSPTPSAAAPAVPQQPAIQPQPGGAMGSGTYGMSVGGQQAVAPQQAPGWMYGLKGLPDSMSRVIAKSMTPDKYMELLAKTNGPQTDIEKLLAAQGIDIHSPEGQAYIGQAIKKINNIPLQAGRAGAPMYDSDGNVIAMAPKIPDNAIPQVVNGRVVGVSPLPGGAGITQTNAYAGAAGVAQTKPRVAYPLGSNQSVFTNDLEASQGGYGPTGPGMPPGAGRPLANMGGGQLTPELQAAILTDAAANGIENPQVNLKAPGISRPVFGWQPNGAAPGPRQLVPEPALGTGVGQENAQNEMGKRWQNLVTQNQEAQNTKSYLDSIKTLATKAAVGPFTDKLQFTNALLSLVGNDRATDATTANALLDKYSNQIVTRLGGSGGLATDSARSILQAAYPNAHMTPDAIAEAADNLSGAQSMVQAKTAMLQQHASARDAAGYTKAEVQFDQNADPRLWQLKNMDPASAQRWLAAQPKSVQADLRRRAGNLKLLGVL